MGVPLTDVRAPAGPAGRSASGGFQHEALLYDDLDGFVAGVGAFVRDGLEDGAPVLVAVDGVRAGLLRSHLGADAGGVTFLDMHEVGGNPARILSVWYDHVAEAAADGVVPRGVGEPVWSERTWPELVECQHHEHLLNLAFADGPAWALLCPYDASHLSEVVLGAAQRSHPELRRADCCEVSAGFDPEVGLARCLTDPLPDPPADAACLPVDRTALAALRHQVADEAKTAGLPPERIDDLVLVIAELTSNSVRHGGGHGELRTWFEDGTKVYEVRDAGRIHDPLVGRRRPPPESPGGRGLWLVNQLTDLVQLRSGEAGTVVRVHLRAGAAGGGA
jgi:anti-sigma regulatory factor (Ser/Thr protein kinase)